MSVLLVLLLVVPLGSALLVLLLPAARGPRGEPLVRTIGVSAGAVTVLVSLLALTRRPWSSTDAVLEVDVPWIPGLGARMHLLLDGISAPLVVLTAVLGLLVVVLVTSGASSPRGSRGLVACLLAVEGGALATFTAADLIVFFVAFEVVLVPMWAVIRWWGDPHDERGRRDAATRFILFTAGGSVVLLLGLLLVVAASGTTDVVALVSRQGDGISQPVQLTAAVLLLLGLAVKVPVWPLHTWLPPAHTAAPTAGSILLAGVLLKMGSYGMVRFVVPVVPDGFARVSPVLGALGVVGIFWAGLACLVERDLKRLVAFSSVAHMGFVALGIASGTPQGLQGALFANVAHGIITSLLFLVAGGLKARYGSADLRVLLIGAGGGLRDRSPRLGGMLVVGCIAGLGLPGLAGFWGEFLAVYGAWQADPVSTGAPQGFWRTLAALAVLGTVLASAYLLRVLRRLWHGELEDGAAPTEPDVELVRSAQGAPSDAAHVDPAMLESGARAAPHLPRDLRPGSRWRRDDASPVEVVVGLPLVVLSIVPGLLPWLLLATTEPAVRHLLAVDRGFV
ncbi:MAG TPA: NADH-quinone oxidoreductase subunit M [Actinomycetales bacterium]|nr:NADH-quinone oxidoreductase subunit M [Actinomycetales bacterium]